MSRPNALVLEAPGINCNHETAFAIEQAGGNPEQVHISQLQSGERKLADYEILALSGGFSHGDAIRSGAVLGLQLKKQFAEDLNEFIEQGKPVIGICNGFQALVESGLLPNGKIDEDQPKTVSLTNNENGKFECRWVNLALGKSACRFIESGRPIELPVAHAEGRFVSPDGPFPPDQTVFRYTTEHGGNASYPQNPNGSPEAIAGITDPSGVVLGMMPHPERFVHTTQHPNWRNGHGENPFGAILFKQLVDYANEN